MLSADDLLRARDREALGSFLFYHSGLPLGIRDKMICIRAVMPLQYGPFFTELCELSPTCVEPSSRGNI